MHIVKPKALGFYRQTLCSAQKPNCWEFEGRSVASGPRAIRPRWHPSRPRTRVPSARRGIARGGRPDEPQQQAIVGHRIGRDGALSSMKAGRSD